MTVPFTQYLLPNGRKKEGGFDRPEPIEAMARYLLMEGVHFDAEVLSTGALSLTAEHDDLDEPVLAIKLVFNQTPEKVAEAVDALVTDALRMLASVKNP